MRQTTDAIAARHHLEGVLFEIVANQLHDVFIVFDDEDSRMRIHDSESIAEGVRVSKETAASLQNIHN